jgi:hypothetical protein
MVSSQAHGGQWRRRKTAKPMTPNPPDASRIVVDGSGTSLIDPA